MKDGKHESLVSALIFSSLSIFLYFLNFSISNGIYFNPNQDNIVKTFFDGKLFTFTMSVSIGSWGVYIYDILRYRKS